MGLIAGLIAPDPADRFPSAEAADLVEQGAASFHRQLVKGDLASEYGNEIPRLAGRAGVGQGGPARRARRGG